MNIVLAAHARRDMKKLDKGVAVRIEHKLKWFAAQQNPLDFSEPLHGKGQKLYRFRIGDYRAIFRIDKGVVTILLVIAIRHRSEAYTLPLDAS